MAQRQSSTTSLYLQPEEPKAEPLHCDDKKVVRKYMEPKTVVVYHS